MSQEEIINTQTYASIFLLNVRFLLHGFKLLLLRLEKHVHFQPCLVTRIKRVRAP